MFVVQGGANKPGTRESGASVSEILSALSHALDLVEGQPRGHAARTAYIADRVAENMGLSLTDRKEAYYSCLLKDAGCSNNSARIHKIFGGDEFLTKQRVKVIDWSSTVESLKFACTNMERGGTVAQKLRRMLASLGPPQALMDDLTRARCTRGAAIAKMLGFTDVVASAVQNIDEHWDGKGAPLSLAGDKIPVLSRLVGLAQTLEVFVSTFGVEAGYEMLEQRNRKWFDPEMVQAANCFRYDDRFWTLHQEHLLDHDINLGVYEDRTEASAADIDAICTAFAEIVDAKSDFTGQHSSRVCTYAVSIGDHMGFDRERLSTLKRAALLHDIGKVGVSNAILDKPGKLTDEEFTAVKLHPQFSYEILRRVKGFERITEIASAHHERLDGKGYWRGIAADELDLDMRIVAVADVYDALSAERPYREALPQEKVFAILDREAVAGLDADCVASVKEISGRALPKAA